MRKQFNLKNYLIPSIVILLTLIVWHKAFYQAFRGEGYTFFLNNKISVDSSPILGFFSRMDIFARLFFKLGAEIFNDNISIYLYLMVLMIVLLNLSFYELVWVLTEKKIIALIASIFFLANYTSSYEMYGLGFYQIFIGRIPNFIPAFWSFIFFVKFLKGKEKIIFYLISVFLYFIATLMSHYSLYFFPIYLFYGLALGRGGKGRCLLLFLPFLLISFVSVLLERFYDPETLMTAKVSLGYLFQEFSYLGTVAYQLVLLALPGKILRLFTEPQIHSQVLGLFWPVVVLYLAGIISLFRKDRYFGKLAVSSALFVVISLFFNVYLREEQVHTLHGYPTSRYFYVPFMALSLLWAIFLYTFCYRRGLPGKAVLWGIVCWWLVANTGLIWGEMDKQQKYHRAVQASLQYIKENSQWFTEDALVVVPHDLGYYGARFCRRFYGGKQMIVAPIFASWEDDENFNLEKLIVLDYDFEQKQVVNKTEEFKELIKNRKKLGEPEFKRQMKEKKRFEIEKGNLID